MGSSTRYTSPKQLILNEIQQILINEFFSCKLRKIVISTLSNWKTAKKNATARKERPNSRFDPVILYLETAPIQSSTGPWSFISPEERKRTCFKPKKKMVFFGPAEQKFHSKTSKCLRRPRISVRSKLHPKNY